MDAWIAAAIFFATYAVIATERVHKTVAALTGAVLMIVFRVIDQQQAFRSIDFNVIFLLLGMMVIANVMRQTGVFQWVAIRSLRVAGADPWRILVGFWQFLRYGVATVLLSLVIPTLYVMVRYLL